jgi:hypothetical protein
MGLAEKVAARFRRAGGTDFSTFVQNPEPRAAFREAVEDARHESGHGGYSGTIAEKSDFEVRRREPMTRDEARRFVDDDLEKNDKWGPAFAIPIAEAAKGAEKKFKVKIPARDENSAREAANKIVQEKYVFGEGGKPAPGVSGVVKSEKVTLLKEGKLPELQVEKGGPEGFKVIGPGTQGKPFPSRAEAVTAFKGHVLRYKPRTGDKYEIVKFKTTDTFTIGDTTKNLHLYLVEGTVATSRSTGKIIGWYFYGIASS